MYLNYCPFTPEELERIIFDGLDDAVPAAYGIPSEDPPNRDSPKRWISFLKAAISPLVSELKNQAGPDEAVVAKVITKFQAMNTLEIHSLPPSLVRDISWLCSHPRFANKPLMPNIKYLTFFVPDKVEQAALPWSLLVDPTKIEHVKVRVEGHVKTPGHDPVADILDQLAAGSSCHVNILKMVGVHGTAQPQYERFRALGVLEHTGTLEWEDWVALAKCRNLKILTLKPTMTGRCSFRGEDLNEFEENVILHRREPVVFHELEVLDLSTHDDPHLLILLLKRCRFPNVQFLRLNLMGLLERYHDMPGLLASISTSFPTLKELELKYAGSLDIMPLSSLHALKNLFFYRPTDKRLVVSDDQLIQLCSNLPDLLWLDVDNTPDDYGGNLLTPAALRSIAQSCPNLVHFKVAMEVTGTPGELSVPLTPMKDLRMLYFSYLRIPQSCVTACAMFFEALTPNFVVRFEATGVRGDRVSFVHYPPRTSGSPLIQRYRGMLRFVAINP